ncbi:MAG: hypothetical protein IT186_26725 [Acidobacteria bacterium]|nr:hypothetical protein [Acidobacteriota bacterium]
MRTRSLIITAAVLATLGDSPAAHAQSTAHSASLAIDGVSTLPVQPVNSSATLIDDKDTKYDADGLIIHADGGGDTAQREGWYWLGVWIRQNTPGLQPWTTPRALNFDQVLKLLEPKSDGVFYRHPKMPPYNNPHGKDFGFSRDQMLPLVAAMGVWGKHAEIRRLWDALPEDALGKHSFNGNWRNFLGQDGANCSDIKKRGCDATQNCGLKTDNRTCSFQEDRRDCSLKTDNTDCSLQEDRRDCGRCILYRPGWPLGDGGCAQMGNDPVCEAAKAAQNVVYAANKAACEATKAARNAGYKAEHDGCEAAKAAENARRKADHDACEAGKAAQNALYKAERDACEIAKTSSKVACEGQKAADQLACFATNIHSGDLIGPAAVNLFRRAIDENPLTPLSSALTLPAASIGVGQLGESELLANVGIRMALASRDRDDTGDDLNLIVSLVLAKLRFPTPTCLAATLAYRSRDHSFGSFISAYRKQYGTDTTDMTVRIADGIRGGWQPEVSSPYGAVRWYHRPDTGANPLLAKLWEPIVARFIMTSP